MKKKIHVMTVKATGHIPVDPTSQDSLGEVAGHVTALRAHLEKLGFGVVVDSRLNRVTAPEPKPEPEAEVDPDLQEIADNLLDIPDNPNRAKREPEPKQEGPKPDPGLDQDTEPPEDDLTVPKNLRRTAEPEAAE